MSEPEQYGNEMLNGVTSSPVIVTTSQSRKYSLRQKIAVMLGIFIVFVLALIAIPMPYVIEAPGPTLNILGAMQGNDGKKQQIIKIKDVKTYPTDGQIRMVTVSLRGGPGSHVTAAEVLFAYLRADREVIPVDQVYPPEATADQVRRASKLQMDQSQQSSAVAALKYLGYQVPGQVVIAEVAKESGLAGNAHKDDVIKALITADGVRHDLVQIWDLKTLLAAIKPDSVVEVVVDRAGKELIFKTKTLANPNEPGSSLLGIYFTPKIQLPVKVDVSVEHIGGPSAGTAFALAIIDQLTPESLTGKKSIAVTGTIDYRGNVGAIGGVVQKMYGARAGGARFFLLPKVNCAEASGHIPSGITAIPVQTLSDAVGSMKEIAAGKTSGFPTCPKQKGK